MGGIVGLGECVMDFIPQGLSENGYTIYQACPGGSVANLCVALAKLGHDSTFAGAVGNDAFGAFLRQTLQGYGVDTRCMAAKDACGTFLAFVHLAQDHERSYSFANPPGADKLLSREDIDLAHLLRYDIVHVSSNSIAGGARTMDTQKWVLEAAAAAGKVICYDINYRANNHLDREHALATLRAPLERADIVKATEEELELVTGHSGKKGAEALLRDSAKVVLVTLGEDGADYYCRDGSGHVAGSKVPVVDTTGAGDAFLGGFLSHMLRQEALGQMNARQVGEAATYGNRVAALSVTRWGAMTGLPTLAELQGCEA